MYRITIQIIRGTDMKEYAFTEWSWQDAAMEARSLADSVQAKDPLAQINFSLEKTVWQEEYFTEEMLDILEPKEKDNG